MDNTSLICNFYMVTLKEGNGGGGEKKASIIYKNCQFLSADSFSFSGSVLEHPQH